MHYKITAKPDRHTKFVEPPFVVRARDYDHAAEIAAYRLYGHRRTITAVRTTGDAGKSGFYHAYLPCSTGGISSHGDPFHVGQI